MQEIVHCYASQSASLRVIPFLPRVEEVVGCFAILEKGNCNLLTQNNPCYFRFSFLLFLTCLLFRPFVFPHGYSGFFSIIFYYFYIYHLLCLLGQFSFISPSQIKITNIFLSRINLIIGNNLFSEIFHRL